VSAGACCNRCGRVKLLLKEDFTPRTSASLVFWLAASHRRYSALLVVGLIPFGSNLGRQKMVIADLNVGSLHLRIVSLGVYGIVWPATRQLEVSVLGGIRQRADDLI